MNIRYAVLLVGLVPGVISSRSSRADDCTERLKPQTEVGERLQLGLSLNSEAPVNLFANGARYIRAQIVVSGQSSCDWSLVIRDEKFRPIQVFKKDDFAGGSRWTNRVYSPHMLIDLQNCTDKSLSFVVQQYIAVPNSAKNPYYSLKNSPNADYQDLYDSPQLDPSSPAVPNSVKRLGDNVAFLMLSYDRQSWICSGVMLAEEFLLTNYHCGGIDSVQPYWREDIISDLLVDISWDGDNVSREYTGSKLLAANADLDYALIRVKAINNTGPVNPIHVLSTDGDIPVGLKLYLVHHPGGNIKKISQNCRVVTSVISDTNYAAGSEFGHDCDSEKGSSGGAVFDRTGTLIGLHHDGFKLDNNCNAADHINKAVLLSRILKDLAVKKPDQSDVDFFQVRQVLASLPETAIIAK